MIENKTKFEFFGSGLYLILIAAMVISAWAFDLAVYGVAAVTALFLFIGLTQKSLKGIVPLLATVVLMLAKKPSLESTFNVVFYASAIVLCIGSTIIFLIRTKQKIHIYAPVFGFLAIFIAAILGGIKNGALFSTTWFIGVAITGVLLLVYFVLSNAIKDYDARFFSGVFVMLSFVIVAQIAIYYYRQMDVIETITMKRIDLGWTISNGIGTILIMIMPFSLYRAANSVFPFIYVANFFICFLAVLATMSRGSILVMIITMVPLLASTLRQSKKVLLTAASIIIMVGSLSALYLVFRDNLQPIIERLRESGVDDSGRFEIWENAINDFKNNLLFGAGFFTRSDLSNLAGIRFCWYHNHILQFMGNMGIVGFGAIMLHLAQRYYYMLRAKTKFSLFAFYGSIMAGSYGLINVTYFTPHFIIPMLLFFIMTHNGFRLRKSLDKSELIVN